MRCLPVFLTLAQILAVELPEPLELGQEAAEITLIRPEETAALARVSAVVADPEENLVLRLSGIEADGEPGVSWEVFVASAEEADCDNVPALAGMLSVFGVPVHEAPGAEMVIPLDAAIEDGKPVGLRIIFRPTSGIEVDGEPVPPIVRSPVRIGALSLETESR